MLPRKRPVQEGDSSDGENLLKKHCVGCFISSSESSTGKSTATEANTTPKDCNKSDSSVIGSSSSNLSSASIRVLPDMAFGNGNPTDIDEDLHSRQLAVYGRETMRRLFASNVLVSGMQGLGVEIAKNLVLAGVKSVTLHDEGTVELWDLSSNFIFSENDVGKNRALASVQKLQELNNAVAISTLTSKLMKEQLSDFQKMQTLHVRPPVTQPPGQSSGSIQMLRAEPSSSSIDDDELSPAQIHEIQTNFQEPSSVNKLHTYSSTRPALLPLTRNYYARPTPPNVLYEETYLNDQGSYHGKTIYEWNIDGETEYGIYKKLHQMLMYATVCRQYSNQDQAIAKFIINGFTGLLKGWWDHVLTLTQQLEILNSVKLEVDPTTNQPVQQQDAVYTLIQTIILHFIGTSTSLHDRGRELLQNLHCPSLTHFRWYKDVFLIKVMQRPDANSTHWKAKFVDGLPTLFAERVRKKLRDRHDRMSIPYEQYTYGQLCSIITDEGLSLCNDLKLHYQMKRQNLTGRKELGEFCNQFAYEPAIKYPGKSRQVSRKKSSKSFRRKPHKTSHLQTTKKFYFVGQKLSDCHFLPLSMQQLFP